jgi:hypothetical protein
MIAPVSREIVPSTTLNLAMQRLRFARDLHNPNVKREIHDE